MPPVAQQEAAQEPRAQAGPAFPEQPVLAPRRREEPAQQQQPAVGLERPTLVKREA